jgi:hypothetical protein
MGCSLDAITPTEIATADYSGTYCLNIQNLEMTIIQSGNTVTFSLSASFLSNGTGAVSGNGMELAASTTDGMAFDASITFSDAGRHFSGPYKVTNTSGQITTEGVLEGEKGKCLVYDLSNGVPQFISADFTQLEKIERISKFRSGFGHSYTDSVESCRSMKHYYNPYENFRRNNEVEIYSPVAGTIMSISNDGHGASLGLNNKKIEIQPDDQPAFILVIFHTDLVSDSIATGKNVQPGELLGYARLYYDDLDEVATSFDIAVWVNTPDGPRLVSYFDTMQEDVFAAYQARGVSERQDFIISQAARDADPLECSGETFITTGNLDNWLILP